jgi:hypothetical protein
MFKLDKAIKKMHTDYVFDKLGFIEMLGTSSRTSQGETPRSKNNNRMQSMQKIELPKMM